MDETYYLTKKVQIGKTKNGLEYLLPEEVRSLKLKKEKSTKKQLIFEAKTFKKKVEFKIHVRNKSKKINGLDSIRVINADRYIDYVKKIHFKFEETFNRIQLEKDSIYITDDGDYFLTFKNNDKNFNGKRVLSLECVLKVPFELKKYKEKMMNDEGHKLFYSLDGEPDSCHFYCLNSNKKTFSLIKKDEIEEKYTIVKSNF